MKVTVNSPKHGQHDFYIDDKDWEMLKSYSFYIWGTKRHTSLYVNCYSPTDKTNSLRLHRVIMNAKKGEIVDHIDRNALDNRRENLRITTSAVNNQNAGKRKDGVTSKHKGVHWCKSSKRWIAQVNLGGKRVKLGSFKTEVEAALKYNSALDIHRLAGPRNIVSEVDLIAKPVIASNLGSLK